MIDQNHAGSTKTALSNLQFRQACNDLQLTANEAAEIFAVSHGRTIRRWWDGSRPLPGPVVVLTLLLLGSDEVRDYFGVSLSKEAIKREHDAILAESQARTDEERQRRKNAGHRRGGNDILSIKHERSSKK